MNEIKFRAWDKRKGKWYHKIIEWIFDRPEGSVGQLPVIPEDIIFMQFTGLKDKNGVEIYEGDIIGTTKGRFYTVEFKEGLFGYRSLVGFAPLLDYPVCDCEIIGNIWDQRMI